LRDYLSFDLPDSSEHQPVTPDLLHLDPFVGLRDPEVNSHDYALVWASPRAQSRPGSQWALGIDDAIAGFGEELAQRVVKEHLVPMPIPGDARGLTASLHYAAQAKDRYGQRPTPGERCDQGGGSTAFIGKPA
jgi:hypothetical protein